MLDMCCATGLILIIIHKRHPPQKDYVRNTVRRRVAKPLERQQRIRGQYQEG